MDLFPPGTTTGTILRALQLLPPEQPPNGMPQSILPPPQPQPTVQTTAPVPVDPFGTKVKGKDQAKVPHGFAYQFNP